MTLTVVFSVVTYKGFMFCVLMEAVGTEKNCLIYIEML